MSAFETDPFRERAENRRAATTRREARIARRRAPTTRGARIPARPAPWPRPTSRLRIRPTLALLAGATAMTAGVWLMDRIERAAPRDGHGVAAVMFAPWISRAEASRRAAEAGGMVVHDPNRRAPSFYLRVIVDDPGFADRVRAQGAWTVAPFIDL